MTPSFLCPADDQSFPSLEKLEEHEKSGHAIKGISTKNQEVTPEFAETLRQMQEDMKSKQLAASANIPASFVGIPGTPLRLEYTFTGVDIAGHPVKTLEIDVNETHFTIAYCEVEKKQVLSWQVTDLTPLNQDYLKTIPKPEPEEPKVEPIKSDIIQPKKERK